MMLFNSDHRYGTIAIFFHWLIAFLVFGMLTLGLYMTTLSFGLQKTKWFVIHKEFGILILMLVSLRLLWRLLNATRPFFPKYLPKWQEETARYVHFAFYMILFLMPLTGWLISSAAHVSVSFFGLFMLPDLIAPQKSFIPLFATLHEWLAYTLMALIVLHIGAVFQHYFAFKENLLRRMWL